MLTIGIRRGLRGAVALAVAAATVAFSSSAASATTYPVLTAFSAAGPYATTTGTATDAAGNAFTLYRPSNYAALGFRSPIVTWGNGTGAMPSQYSILLTRFASYGFTVIASNLANTGSGNEIAAGAQYLVTQNGTAGSAFQNHLDTAHVAAVGHSQGATGAMNAANHFPGLITTVMTFSKPDDKWAGTNPDCPTVETCTAHPELLTQPTFLISTHGFWLDSWIAPPATEETYYNSIPAHACLGIIQKLVPTVAADSPADHNSVQDSGPPGDELDYSTAWLEYELRGSATAAPAFTPTGELSVNTNWWVDSMANGGRCK